MSDIVQFIKKIKRIYKKEFNVIVLNILKNLSCHLREKLRNVFIGVLTINILIGG